MLMFALIFLRQGLGPQVLLEDYFLTGNSLAWLTCLLKRTCWGRWPPPGVQTALGGSGTVTADRTVISNGRCLNVLAKPQQHRGVGNRHPLLVKWELGSKGPAGVTCERKATIGRRQKPTHSYPAVSRQCAILDPSACPLKTT